MCGVLVLNKDWSVGYYKDWEFCITESKLYFLLILLLFLD